jgi:hypothetical protein
MCGSPDDGLKSRQHELILFNVTYENFKLSYSFMVIHRVTLLIDEDYEIKVVNKNLLPITGQSRQIQLHVDDKQFQFLSGGNGRSIKIIYILSRRKR